MNDDDTAAPEDAPADETETESAATPLPTVLERTAVAVETLAAAADRIAIALEARLPDGDEPEEEPEVEPEPEPEAPAGSQTIPEPRFGSVSSKDRKIFANFGRNPGHPFKNAEVYDLRVKGLDEPRFAALGISSGYKAFVSVPLGKQTLCLQVRNTKTGDFSEVIEKTVTVR